MASRAEKSIIEWRVALDKISSGGEDEKVLDIVASLKGEPMTIELLSATGIGGTFQTLKKSYANTEAGTQVKALMSKWRKECNPAAATTATATASEETKTATTTSTTIETTAPTAVPTTAAAAAATAVSSSSSSSFSSSSSSTVTQQTTVVESKLKAVSRDAEDDMDESHYENLEPMRKRMMDLFTEHFKNNTEALSIAKFLAFNVEASINKLHSFTGDGKNYLQKAKSIAYNLKKNEILRMNVISGNVDASSLAVMTANDLASDALKETRLKTGNDANLARRGDLYEITRSEILTANGIDPNAQGDFVCRRCKGSKCTHYSMQTRSSDEPMTVFVCCLTCGKRWRE